MPTCIPTSTPTTSHSHTSVIQPYGVSVSSFFTTVGPRLLLLLVMAAWLAIAKITPPAVVTKAAPVKDFSAGRALAYLPAIAKEPPLCAHKPVQRYDRI
jgi:hypothetical protein